MPDMDNSVLDEEIFEYDDFPRHEHLATTGHRFLNYIIDRIMIYGLIIAFAGLVDSVESAASDFSDIYVLLFLVLIIGYYPIMEAAFGQTVGKMLTGTKVVTSTGDRIHFGHALLRSLFRLVPFEAFSAFISDRKMWHDQWASTRVVLLNKVPEDRKHR